MATFTKTIPSELLDEAIDAYCDAYDYQPFIQNENNETIANPESKVQFAKRMDREHTVNIIKQYRVKVLETQRATLNEQAETDCAPITVE